MIQRQLHRSPRLAVVLAVLVLFAPSARAGIHGWVGPSSGGLWSNGANWDTGVPTSGEMGGTIVAFASNVVSTQNIAGLVVDRIVFFGSGNTIHGSTPLGLRSTVITNNISDSSGGNTLASDLGVVLDGTAANPVQVNVAGGTLTLAANLSGAAGDISIAGNVALNGVNGYTGTVTVKSGVVTLNSSSTAITEDVTVGDNVGAANSATLREMSNSNIANGANVYVGSDGRFDLNGFDEVIAGLGGVAGSGGSVTLGATSLLQLDLTGGSYRSFPGIITGAGSVTIGGDGSRIQYFYGNNTYSGPTVVNGGGILSIDGSQAASHVTVNGGILLGAGTMGNTDAMSGSVNPGLLYGGSSALHAGTVSLASGFSVNVGTGLNPPNDSLAATGPITLGNSTLVLQVGASLNDGDVFTILTTPSSLTGTFAGLPNNDSVVAPGGKEFRVNYTPTAATLTYCATTAPTVTAPGAATITQSVCQ
ncbi:MAG TPA: hypothetical protein VGR00_15395 [Thermoanaerobaculia bacterium]|nr:hypothetical protein [Thermoanaerobaculia bacterium]